MLWLPAMDTRPTLGVLGSPWDSSVLPEQWGLLCLPAGRRSPEGLKVLLLWIRHGRRPKTTFRCLTRGLWRLMPIAPWHPCAPAGGQDGGMKHELKPTVSGERPRPQWPGQSGGQTGPSCFLFLNAAHRGNYSSDFLLIAEIRASVCLYSEQAGTNMDSD